MIKSTIRMLLLAGACLTASSMLAQSTTQGAIIGTVFDNSDAVIPNATIVIHNNGTNAELKLQSDSAGLFRAPQLPPGTYTVTINAAGFSGLRTSHVTVEVNVPTPLDVHLKTGDSSQVVEVTATAPVLNFDDASFGGHLSNVEIEGLPI